jgi:hypothetical protein
VRETETETERKGSKKERGRESGQVSGEGRKQLINPDSVPCVRQLLWIGRAGFKSSAGLQVLGLQARADTQLTGIKRLDEQTTKEEERERGGGERQRRRRESDGKWEGSRRGKRSRVQRRRLRPSAAS